MSTMELYQLAASEDYSLNDFTAQVAFASLNANPDSYCDLAQAPQEQ